MINYLLNKDIKELKELIKELVNVDNLAVRNKLLDLDRVTVEAYQLVARVITIKEIEEIRSNSPSMQMHDELTRFINELKKGGVNQ